MFPLFLTASFQPTLQPTLSNISFTYERGKKSWEGRLVGADRKATVTTETHLTTVEVSREEASQYEQV